MLQSPLTYFTDPVLRAPTIGSMLMCLSASLVGVVVLLRRQSLVGETLAHASYPGVMLGVILAAALDGTSEGFTLAFCVLGGAAITAYVGLWFSSLLQTRYRVRADSALCFVLAAFFGIGVTLASQLQFTETALYRQGQNYLFGQAATMTDWHIYMYAALALATVLLLSSLYKELQLIVFDRTYAITQGVPVNRIETLLSILLVLAVVIGLRSVGVVLMSAMLIAPAAAARQYTNKLYIMLGLAALFGVVSGFLGNYLAIEFSQNALALPTGPSIVIVAAFICISSLLLAPERGLLRRLLRITLFRFQCICENVLKTMWRISPDGPVGLPQIAKFQGASSLYLQAVLFYLRRAGWVDSLGYRLYRLNHDGQLRAAKIVRLHRLWEVYLADYLGVGAEKVHHNAEEMEHILTPEIEEALTRLLNDPKRDPHLQPIPPKGTL